MLIEPLSTNVSLYGIPLLWINHYKNKDPSKINIYPINDFYLMISNLIGLYMANGFLGTLYPPH